MSDTFLVLTNPSFKFEWNGSSYDVKKASLAQVALFSARSRELNEGKDDAAEYKLTAYSIYLILKSQIPDLTEESVMENTIGDVSPMDVFISLGFMSPAKFQAAMEKAKTLISENSGQTLPTEPDGPQQ